MLEGLLESAALKSGFKNAKALGLIMTPKPIQVKTFGQMTKIYAKSLRGSVRSGYRKGMQLLKHPGKFLTKVAVSVGKVGAKAGAVAIAKFAKAFVGPVLKKVMIGFAIWGIVSDFQDLIEYFGNGQIALGAFATCSMLAGVFTVGVTVAAMVSAAAGIAFTAGTTAAFLTGPVAPLIGCAVGAVAALGALVVSLLSGRRRRVPGNNDYGDELCCLSYYAGVEHKYLQGSDNPVSRYNGKNEGGCNNYVSLLQVLPGPSNRTDEANVTIW